MRRSEIKTISEFIIDALREGSFLRTPDITERVAQASGREIRLQDISSVLTKITSYKMSDLGCLIEKKKTHRGYAYRLVREALKLPPQQIYDLSRKTRKNNQPRFTLDQAINMYPELRKHVSSGCRANKGGNGRRDTGALQTGRAGLLPEKGDRQFSRILSTVLGRRGLNINLNLYVCVDRPLNP